MEAGEAGLRGLPQLLSSPAAGAPEYHQERQEEDDGAPQVGVLVQPRLVVRAVDEPQSHFLLWKAPNSSQTPELPLMRNPVGPGTPPETKTPWTLSPLGH